MPEAFLFEGFIAQSPAAIHSFSRLGGRSLLKQKLFSITADKLKLNNITPLIFTVMSGKNFPVTAPQ